MAGFYVLRPEAIRIKFALAEDSERKTKSCRESFIFSNKSIHILIDDTQAKNIIIFDVMKFMIHLAWVANSMVIFSASYTEEIRNFPVTINFLKKIWNLDVYFKFAIQESWNCGIGNQRKMLRRAVEYGKVTQLLR